VQLLNDFLTGLGAVPALGVILRALLVSIAILHTPRVR
jgi:hypothetical protein